MLIQQCFQLSHLLFAFIFLLIQFISIENKNQIQQLKYYQTNNKDNINYIYFSFDKAHPINLTQKFYCDTKNNFYYDCFMLMNSTQNENIIKQNNEFVLNKDKILIEISNKDNIEFNVNMKILNIKKLKRVWLQHKTRVDQKYV